MHRYLKLVTAAVLLTPLSSLAEGEANTQLGVQSVTTTQEGGLSAPAPKTGKRDATFSLTDSVDSLQEIAKVNNRSILMQEVAQPLEHLRLSYVEAPDKVHYLLDQLITNEILAQEALRLGLDREPQVAEKLLASKRKVVATAMGEKLQGQNRKEQLKHYYTQHPEEFRSLKVAQILVKEKTQADDIYNQLVNGADFATLAKQYSTDRTTRNKGGELGDMLRGMAARSLEKLAYSLKPGEVGKPISTGLGYHILKVLAEGKPKPFGELEPEEINGIKTYIYNNKIDQLRAAATIIVHPELITLPKPPADAAASAPLASIDGSPATAQSNLNNLMMAQSAAPQVTSAVPQVIATVNGMPITSADFVQKLNSVKTELGPYYSTPTGKLELLDQLITRELLYQEGVRLKLDQDENIGDMLAQPARAILTQAMRDKIEREKQNKDEVKAFYDAHPYDFRTVEVAHIQVDHQEEADAIYKALVAGEDFAQLVEKHSTDAINRNQGGRLGDVNLWSGLDRPMQDAILALDVNQVSAPLPSQFGYQIYKVTGAKDPIPFADLKPFQLDAVKTRIFHYELDKLLKNATIVIHPDPVNELIAAKKEEDKNREF